ncbi:MAG: hypothetical protein ACLR5B_09990 [Blautia sp.]
MKLPNGYGSVTKMSGKRRNPWVVRKTDGYILDPEKGTKKQNYIIIGYAFEICICNKDYSTYVDVAKYKDRNPNKLDRNKFSKEEVERVWTMQEDSYYQIVLMLLYNGCRISEFLDLKKENVHLEDCRTFRSNDSYRTCLHAS